MTKFTKTEAEFNRLYDEYTNKAYAFIYESTELLVSIMYGRTGQYAVTIVRPR